MKMPRRLFLTALGLLSAIIFARRADESVTALKTNPSAFSLANCNDVTLTGNRHTNAVSYRAGAITLKLSLKKPRHLCVERARQLSLR